MINPICYGFLSPKNTPTIKLSFPSCLRVVVNRELQGNESYDGALATKDLVDQEGEQLRRVVQDSEVLLVGSSIVLTDAMMHPDEENYDSN